MPTNIIYHTAQPQAIQDGGYVSYNNIDFVINPGENRSLMKNSVRLNGTIQINSATTTRVVAADRIFLDHKLGVHACIDSLQVSFGGSLSGEGGGIRENIANYARYAEMLTVATNYEDDYLNASQSVELRCPTNDVSQLLSQGRTASDTSAIAVKDYDFSLKPHCILNSMAGDDVPLEKSGEIRLVINLARDIAALMGADQTSSANYTLRDLHVSFRSVPTDGLWSSKTTRMSSVYNVKSSILSGQTNISAQVPAVCQSVSCSFQNQSSENVAGTNNNELNTLQGITRVAFLFNDATNKYVTYQIDDQNEMLHRYIDSFKNTGHNQVMLDTFRTNGGFGVGLDFNGSVDLSNQRFAVQLDSAINASKPMNMYLYFHSVQSI